MIRTYLKYILCVICTLALLYIGVSLSKTQEEIQLLHNQNKFIMKHLSGGIQNITPAYGTLRTRQEQLFKSLLEFDKLAQEHSIEYWLDYGTLLGAIRHNGFIPWDDDIDISMTEENLAKLQKLVDDKSYGSSLKPAINNPRQMLWYITNQFGTFDIFSHVFINRKDFDNHAKYTSFIHNFKFLFGKYVQYKILDHLDSIRQTPEINNFQDYFVVTRTTKPHGFDSIYRSNFKAIDIFPLKKHIFEGHEFPVPNNSIEVLKIRYGEGYNDLPDNFGYSHHIDSW